MYIINGTCTQLILYKGHILLRSFKCCLRVLIVPKAESWSDMSYIKLKRLNRTCVENKPRYLKISSRVETKMIIIFLNYIFYEHTIVRNRTLIVCIIYIFNTSQYGLIFYTLRLYLKVYYCIDIFYGINFNINLILPFPALK